MRVYMRMPAKSKHMPSERKPISESEWAFYRAISTPSVFTEWVYDHEQLQPPQWHGLWRKQIRELNREESKKRRVQGRFLGKSMTCSTEFLQACILATRPGEALVASRLEHNLRPIWEKFLVEPLKRHPFLKLFMPHGDNDVNRKAWQITLANNVKILGRIEGKEASGFASVHPDIIAWIDEVQLLSDDAVAEFYGMVSAHLRILASGVPNGVRSSWAYKIDNDTAGTYGFAGGRMTRLDDPTMTEQRIHELQEQHGGPQSSGYLNRVMGEWGADSRMTFDMARITLDLPVKPGEVRSVKPPFYRSVEIDAGDIAKPDGTAKTDVLAMRFAFRGDMPKADSIWFAADHGQSASPTTLYIHFLDSKEHVWRQFHRVLLHGMEAPTQASVIGWLANEIKRMTGISPVIGMDTTGQGGSAVMASLQPLGFELMRVDVRENVQAGLREETEEEVRRRFAKDPFSPSGKQMVPDMQPVRQVAFPRLARELYAGRARLVNEDMLVKQLEGTTDSEGKNGQRIYECDYHVDGRVYNHDESAWEIFGAMLAALDTRQELVAPEAWAEPMPIAWGSVA